MVSHLNQTGYSTMNKHTVDARLILALVAVVGLMLAACQPTATPTVEPTEPSWEGEVEAREAISKDILLDPAILDPEDKDSLQVCSLIYEGLVGVEDDSPVPALAASWTVSDDGLDYIFNLRPDAVFNDGTPVDADAVMANFNRWFDPEDPLHGSGSYKVWESIMLGFKGETNEDGSPKSSFDGIEKVDNLTVLIHLSRQDPELLVNLALPAFGIVNPAVLEAEGEAYGTRDGSAVGTGPYMVSTWTDESLLLQPNPNYWGGPPEAGLEFPLQ
jgi:peptide/nickel transport system substrate-binding protein